MDERYGPTLLQWAALAALVVLTVTVSTLRIPMADVPWQLATGRLIVEHGDFLTTNTFSWTHPDSPLFQQSPFYQALLYGVWKVAGFNGLSVLTMLLWSAVAVVWIRWGGTWRDAAQRSPVWLLAIIGMQRHLLLRPEALSLLFLGLLLLCLDALRRDDSWRWVAAAIAIQWLWANSHQLFAIGIAVQVAFLIHLILSRKLRARTIDAPDGDRTLPLGKPLTMIAGAVVASCGTPLGFRSLLIPFQSVGTLVTQGDAGAGAQTAELASVTTDPIATFVVVAGLVVVGYAAIRARGRLLWFELAMIVLGLGLVAAALRGIGFFSLLTMAVAARWLGRGTVGELRLLRQVGGPAVTILVSSLLVMLFISLTSSFLRVQGGWGRAVGEWPDATIAYLDANEPNGKILNVGWAAANVLIWEGYEVFVGPRWEAYPREFLLESIDAMSDPALLEAQIQQWQPDTIVAELRHPEVQETMAHLVGSGRWSVAHADTLHLVLVPDPQPVPAEFTGWHSEHPRIHAQEKIRVACWHDWMGESDRAAALRAEATSLVDPAVLASDLRKFGDCGP